MSAILVTMPFQVFKDNDGNPLESGYVYIGQENLNPITTPISVYWDEALTIPAAQPLRTTNGFLSRNGKAANIFAAQKYSIMVKDRNGVLLYSSLNTPIPVTDASLPWIDASAYGPSKNDTTISAAMTYATSIYGASGKYGILIRRGDWTISSNLTVPSNVQLIFEQGAVLNIATGVTVTYNGPGIVASLSKIFALSGTGKFVFSGAVEFIFAEWWGAVRDGVTDDSAAIQSALNQAFGRRVILLQGTYYIANTLTIDTTGLGDISGPAVCGNGMFKTFIDNQTGGPAFYYESGTSAEFVYACKVHDLSIISTGTNPGTIGIRIDGSRLCSFRNISISGMASHGVYGLSVSGDFTDTSSIIIEQCQIESCGGYGIYATGDTGGIQYSWNLYECRIGLCTLGGVFYESMINAKIEACGIYYNNGFGIKISRKTGGDFSRLISIINTEFDTNDGTQLDVDFTTGLRVDGSYLVANVTSTVFATGILIGSDVVSGQILASNPRIHPSITGIAIHQFESGCSDIVVRDTNYSGFSSLNGDMYIINEPTVVIDDYVNRLSLYSGTYTVEIRDSTGTKVSSTTGTGHYVKVGPLVTVGFRDINAISTAAFIGTDIITVTLPFPAKLGATSAYIGNCIITTDSGSGNPPAPVVPNGSPRALFKRAGSAALLIASDLTTGVSSITDFTIIYISN